MGDRSSTERRVISAGYPDATGFDAVGKKIPVKPNTPWKLIAVGAWLAFSIALAIWWLIFGLQQIERFQELGAANLQVANELARHHRMLMSEGATLILLLLAGGAALLYYIRTEIRRARRIQEFLGAFTHDLKTSLASLRLQAESLEEDLKESGQGRLARRLVKDTIRLEIQLENALLLAAPDSNSSLLIEPVRLEPLLSSLAHLWPDLSVAIDGDGIALADTRALESVFKNLTQNAVVHGKANKLTIDVVREGLWTMIRFVDDGRGFHGEISKLGRMFERHSSTSGSGLGIGLAMRLMKGMGGDLRVIDVPQGFTVELLLPTAIDSTSEDDLSAGDEVGEKRS